jgi:hypothetical protein
LVWQHVQSIRLIMQSGWKLRRTINTIYKLVDFHLL